MLSPHYALADGPGQSGAVISKGRFWPIAWTIASPQTISLAWVKTRERFCPAFALQHGAVSLRLGPASNLHLSISFTIRGRRHV